MRHILVNDVSEHKTQRIRDVKKRRVMEIERFIDRRKGEDSGTRRRKVHFLDLSIYALNVINGLQEFEFTPNSFKFPRILYG